MASPVALLVEAHGAALRLLADSRGVHDQGPHVATCHKTKAYQALATLEIAHNYARHITGPVIASLVGELRDALIGPWKLR